MHSSNDGSAIAVAVGMNMRTAADEQTRKASEYGVSLDVKSEVFVNDGSKAWPGALATTLCGAPELASGTRSDMAVLITKTLVLTKPFSPARLSRALSTKARAVVREILGRFGYNTMSINTGLDIRDSVKNGFVTASNDFHTINTRFEFDGVWLGNNWHPYFRYVSYETGKPWYCLGLRIAGDLIQLKTVLAMRDIGIGQFIQLDEAASRVASGERQQRRKSLLSS